MHYLHTLSNYVRHRFMISTMSVALHFIKTHHHMLPPFACVTFTIGSTDTRGSAFYLSLLLIVYVLYMYCICIVYV